MVTKHLNQLMIYASPVALLGVLASDLSDTVKMQAAFATLAVASTVTALDLIRSRGAGTLGFAGGGWRRSGAKGAESMARVADEAVWSRHAFREGDIARHEGVYAAFQGDIYLGRELERYVRRGMRLPTAASVGVSDPITWRRKIWSHGGGASIARR